MNARSAVHALLTAYLVSVLTGAWLAVMAGGLRVLGWLWAPILADVLGWFERWFAVVILGGVAAVALALVVSAMIVPVMLVFEMIRMNRRVNT